MAERAVRDGVGVEARVQAIEEDGEDHRRERRPLPARAHEEGEDERALQVVELPEAEEEERHEGRRVLAAQEDDREDQRRRELLHDPGEARGQLGAEAPARVAAVGSGHEEERHEGGQSRSE